MNYLDLAIAIPLIWGLYKGFSKGLINSLATLAALILGIIGAIKFSGATSVFLAKNLNIGTTYLPMVSFAITFIGIIIAIHFLARIIDKLLSAVALGGINRIAGAIFGLAKYGFIISVILIILNYIDNQVHFLPKEKTEKSLLYEPVAQFAPTVIPYIDLEKLKTEVQNRVPNIDTDSIPHKKKG